ncbi:MAG TPA: hypothetical protein VER58_01345 [Thermoanaerobaculia bacterium]|nr:hypothetical protein [Thermoanaerobaculia bacterium]
MQAFGSDRVRKGDGEQITLFSRISKGWTPRVEKTLTTAEFPGTAVFWEEQYFEVVIADALPQGGVRYVLEPWREHHMMRFVDRYDAGTEATRIEENRKDIRREKARVSANLLGLLTGHLPAVVQNELGREIGVLPPRLTFISILGTLLVIGLLVLYCVSRIMAQEPPPMAAIIPAVYLGIENTIRFFINWTQSRPIGSTVGFIVYALFYAITRRGPSPFAEEKGWKVKIVESAPEVAARDAFRTRSAFVTLLRAADQARVAQRYDYDYRRDSAKVAIVILIFAVIGAVASYRSGKVVPAIVAALIAVEQIARMIAFQRGPTGSVFGLVVRPFVRKLL